MKLVIILLFFLGIRRLFLTFRGSSNIPDDQKIRCEMELVTVVKELDSIVIVEDHLFDRYEVFTKLYNIGDSFFVEFCYDNDGSKYISFSNY